jgi:hypothetical protein
MSAMPVGPAWLRVRRNFISNCLPASHVLALAMSGARKHCAPMVQMSAARLPARHRLRSPEHLCLPDCTTDLKQRNHGPQARPLIFVNQDMGIDEFDASRRRVEASTP